MSQTLYRCAGNLSRVVRVVACFAAAAYVVACGSDSITSPDIQHAKSNTLSVFSCTAKIGARSISCEEMRDPLQPNYSMSIGPVSGGPRDAIIIGGQRINVEITTSNITNDVAAKHFSFDLRLKNLRPQPIGTTDGLVSDSSIAVFFSSGPYATVGSGSVSVFNPTGIGTFTAPNQFYFSYPEMLPQNATTASKNWILAYESNVQEFAFDLLVSASVPYPNGYIEVTASPDSVIIGTALQLEKTARDRLGYPIANQFVDWNWSDINMASITASGSLTGYLPGFVTATARGAGGITGSIRIKILDLPPVRFSAVSPHEHHSCALSTTGIAYCWGRDYLGTLGAGDPPPITTTCGFTLCTYIRLAVAGGHVFSSMSEGMAFHTCAIASDGAYCWGNSDFGQTGNGAEDVATPIPSRVQSSAVYTSISVGVQSTCAVTTQHAIDCWGSNSNGQLGDPSVTTTCSIAFLDTPASCSTTPRRVSSAVLFDKVSLGGSNACALSQDGVAYCWGAGIGSTPTAVTTDLRFTDISVGDGFVCAVATGGRAYCWGANNIGQLGNGSTSSSPQPAPTAVNSTSSFVKVSSGQSHVCAIDTSGSAFCWGANTTGQLGDGTLVNNTTSPVPVTGGLKFTSLSAGVFTTCGIATDNYAYCWGWNTYLQLGVASPGSSRIPLRVSHQ